MRTGLRVRARLRHLARLAHARLTMLHLDQRGDVPERTLATALMVGLAITVVGIITAKVIGWANAISGP